ncbi:PhnA-like protein [Sinorhizobium numidicum]|uniref:PhnA-like protein n=1 Tax=Sinorhizobium numidicum TaxID=680248 RepID=A0ABY8CT44_9HYPH|nr:PhnA-like protein [Sinorhizobium numidicum]WEX74510.1 PhnA-like protein [Sinorhizobium numidicum]WEX80500.1 PhnA-like protein [Sinorhizobium numidicum]
MTDPVLTSRGATSSEPLTTAAFNKVSWGGIFAGVAVALAVQFLLNLLGVGIGAAVIDPGGGDNPEARTFSIAGGLWFVLSGIIAAFVGGYLASRLSGRPSTSTGGYHGLTTWAVTTLVVLYLLTTSVGTLVGGAFSGLTGVIGGAGRTVATAAITAAPALATATDPFAEVERQIRAAAGGTDPAAMRDAAVVAVRALVTGDEAQAEEARNRAADALARAQNIPPEEARARVEQYEQSYRSAVDNARREATEAADAAATVISSGAFLGFIALVLGAIAAWFGGLYGTRHAERLSELS